MKRKMSLIGLVVVMMLAMVIPASAAVSWTEGAISPQWCGIYYTYGNDTVGAGNTNVRENTYTAAYRIVVRDKTTNAFGQVNGTLVTGGWTTIMSGVAISIYPPNHLLYINNTSGHNLDVAFDGVLYSGQGGRCAW